MKIAEMDFGSLDAQNEIINHGAGGDKKFQKTFVSPPRFAARLNNLNRVRYVTGLKGTGKTALLRYIAIHEKNAVDSIQHFVMFRRSLTEEDKGLLSEGVKYKVALNTPKAFDYDQDFEDVWAWFFHREICALISEKSGADCFDAEGLKQYKDFVAAFSDEETEKKGWVTSLFPKLKSGGFKVSLDVPVLKAEFGGELDLDKKVHTISLAKVVSRANNLLARLKSKQKHLSIFIDEVEISVSNSSVFKRDCLIVRDLIISINNMNMIFWRAGLKCRLVCALRSEVLGAVEQFGKETNKLVSDFGFDVRWNVRDQRFEHPLFTMISAKVNGLSIEPTPTQFLSSVLPRKVSGVEAWDFILHRTWYRPRDLVRFFNAIRDEAIERDEDAEAFVAGDLTKGMAQYSRESWREIGEELRAQFSANGVRLLKEVFTGFKTHFSIGELMGRIEEIRRKENAAADVLQGLTDRELVRSLYRVGIVGNEYLSNVSGGMKKKKQAWAHKGDVDVLPDRKLMVHRGLHKVFKLEMEKA